MQNKKDLTRTQVTNMLREKGISLCSLSVSCGLRPNTLGNALRSPYKRGEVIIAKALELNAEDIWPERWAARNHKKQAEQRMREIAKEL